jgi:glycosyltransferase involved in cell wall biosynthesis
MLTYITTCRDDIEYLDTVEETIKYCNDPDFRAIVVDDFSSTPLYDIVSRWNDPRVSLFRITEDKGFNSHGARNLAMQHTTTKWNCLVDIDYRVVGVDNIIRMIKDGDLEDTTPHFFPVIHTFEGQTSPHRESINDFVVTKQLFWKVGGYDPEFIGLHSGDRLLIARMMANHIHKMNSLLFDAHLEALRSPYSTTVIDESITNPRSERFSDDRRFYYIGPTTDNEIRQSMAAAIRRHAAGLSCNPTPFKWEKQI